ncbi:MAG: protein kinase domain-containing protein, partial [Planctomyces sp.]
MSATSSSGDLLVDQIAEEFMQKLRRGEQPKISEYTQRYPKIAGQLKSQLKFLQMLEQAGSNSRRMQPLVHEIQTLTPDLKILEFIGSGGMGSVWKARQLSLERTVAIKVLHQQMFDWELSRERFLEEARIASNLTHEHIVPVHDVFPRAAQPYYLMQFI